MTTDLDAAVFALTNPTTTKVPVGDRWVTVHHEPLLVQLQEAVTSAIGNGGGGGQVTGVPLNSMALYHLEVILSQLRDWCRMVWVRPTRNPVADLLAWRDAFTGSGVFHATKLEEWAGTIRELLDPPKRVPLADPCVACKADKVVDPEGAVSRPVVVEYDQADPLRTAVARCRVCDARWSGVEAIEELMEELGGTA